MLKISVIQVLWCSSMFCYKDQNLNTPNLPLKIIMTTHENFISIMCNIFILTSYERYSCSCIILRWEDKLEILKCYLPQSFIPFSIALFPFFFPTIDPMQETSYSKMANWSLGFWMLCGFLPEHYHFKAILRVPCGRNIPMQRCTNDRFF